MAEQDRVSALLWIQVEHSTYQGDKFDEKLDDLKTADDWERRIGMYLHRAKILGLDNPLGRQAVGKAAATSVAYLETMFRVHGSVLDPGVPSGEQG